MYWKWNIKKFLKKKSRSGKKLMGLAKLSYLQDPMSDRNFFLSATLAYWGIVDSHGTSFQHTDVLFILMWSHSSILICYWFSCDLIPAYWCINNSHVTPFQHTEILLILMVPHSTILMCYWFSCYLIPAYWGIVNSQVTSF